MDRSTTCCFTGHRITKLPWRGNEADARALALKEQLYSRLCGIYAMGYRHFICGMAVGCDTYFAEAVLKLRDSFPDVTLEAAIPCGGQPDRWPLSDRLRYNRILNSCNKITVLQVEYTPDCMMKRNRYMVDSSSLLLACFDGSPGGTRNTVEYAKKQNLDIIYIDI